MRKSRLTEERVVGDHREADRDSVAELAKRDGEPSLQLSLPIWCWLVILWSGSFGRRDEQYHFGGWYGGWTDQTLCLLVHHIARSRDVRSRCLLRIDEAPGAAEHRGYVAGRDRAANRKLCHGRW